MKIYKNLKGKMPLEDILNGIRNAFSNNLINLATVIKEDSSTTPLRYQIHTLTGAEWVTGTKQEIYMHLKNVLSQVGNFIDEQTQGDNPNVTQEELSHYFSNLYHDYAEANDEGKKAVLTKFLKNLGIGQKHLDLDLDQELQGVEESKRNKIKELAQIAYRSELLAYMLAYPEKSKQFFGEIENDTNRAFMQKYANQPDVVKLYAQLSLELDTLKLVLTYEKIKPELENTIRNPTPKLAPYVLAI